MCFASLLSFTGRTVVQEAKFLRTGDQTTDCCGHGVDMECFVLLKWPTTLCVAPIQSLFAVDKTVNCHKGVFYNDLMQQLYVEYANPGIISQIFFLKKVSCIDSA